MSAHEQLVVIGRGKAGRALARALDVQNLPGASRPGGLVILAVPDRVISEVGRHFRGRCVHLSGSLHDPEVPSAHPLVSFDGEPADWTGVPLAVTGPAPVPIVAALRSLGFCPFELPADKKALYHAAAVMTSGHAATLWLGAQNLLEASGVVLPGGGLAPLAQATLDNIRKHGAGGRTGPFVRGDRVTIERDRDALPEPWRSLFVQLGEAPIGPTE